MNAYGEGYEAFHRGVDRERNPYATGLSWWRQWFEGWDAAFRASY
jgi:ribosome modulation factor